MKLYRSYDNPDFVPVFDWVMKKGKSSYMKFLLTHPGYLLLFDETKEERARVFCYSLSYISQPSGYYLLPDRFLPLFKPWFVVVLCCVIFVLYLKSKGVDYRLVFPLFLLLLATANAYLSYNADAMEVERHLFFTRMLSELIGLISLFLIIDFLIGYWKEKRKSTIEKNSADAVNV
jgi:hypothetical protein